LLHHHPHIHFGNKKMLKDEEDLQKKEDISFPLHSNQCHSPPPKTWIKACVHITQETSKEAVLAHLSLYLSLSLSPSLCLSLQTLPDPQGRLLSLSLLQTLPDPQGRLTSLSLSGAVLQTPLRPTRQAGSSQRARCVGESLTPGRQRRPDTWELQQLGLVCLYLWQGSFWA
jgi:hypothetical protein